MKKNIVIGLTVSVLIVVGCGKDGQENNESGTPGRIPSHTSSAPAAAPLQGSPSSPASRKNSAPHQTELMKKMGLQVESGRIILDTEKSKNFFESLGKAIEKNIHQGMEKAEQHVPSGEDLGIQMDDKKVVIDLNKTKNFMKVWVETLEVLGRELNRSLAPIQP